jgi:hypothetical protein
VGCEVFVYVVHCLAVVVHLCNSANIFNLIRLEVSTAVTVKMVAF